MTLLDLPRAGLRWLRTWWRQELPPPQLPHYEPPPPVPPAAPEVEAEADLDSWQDAEERHQWRFEREAVEQAGTFYFKAAILDELKEYFVIIRRLRHVDRDGYNMFAKLGAAILPWQTLSVRREFPAIWHDPKTRPGFGAVWFFDPDDKLFLPVKLAMFQKLDAAPRGVEATPHQVYCVTLYYDRVKVQAGDKKWLIKRLRKAGFGMRYHVSLDRSGDIKLLKELITRHHKIVRKHKRWDRKQTRPHGPAGYLPQQVWDYPDMLVDVWKDFQKDFKSVMGIDEYVADFFKIVAQFEQGQHTGIRINLHDGDTTAAFAVDFKRSAYFFRDREITALARDGRRKRIFHIVRPHARHLATKATYVRTHFRGLRDFEWNGYRVHITVPGWHHPDLLRATFSAVIMPDDEPMPPDMMTVEQGVKRLAAGIAGKPHRWSPHESDDRSEGQEGSRSYPHRVG
jgi:hypothetical protein